VSADATDFARQLREDHTFAEARLWEIVRNRRLGGFKFRRQRPIGPYFADFCCIEAKLIVELDGDSHLGRERYDEARTNYLRDNGWYVFRVENFEVRLCEQKVCERILYLCRARAPKVESPADSPSPLTPLPLGRGEPPITL
jgi:adenine-specific DNA-methyltransferase